MYNQDEKLKEILNSEKLDTTLAMNILINSIRANWDRFSTLDKYLIGRALKTIEYHAERKEDLVIKFK